MTIGTTLIISHPDRPSQPFPSLQNLSGSDTEKRIRELQKALTELVFGYVSRALFTADRLMFALHPAHGTKPDMFHINVSRG